MLVAGIALLVLIIPTARLAIWDRSEEGGGQIDGFMRVVAIHPLRDFPLIDTVSAAEKAVLADWGRQSLLLAFGALCAAIGFALLFRALVARSRALERSEATLRESEARCRDFALTSSDWFWETDEKHQFSYLSDHIRAFGQDPQTRVGRTRTELAVDVGSEPAKWQEHLAVLDRHEPFREFVYKRKIGDDPERVISVGGNPFFERRGGFSAIGELLATSLRRLWPNEQCTKQKPPPRLPISPNRSSSPI
jgi:PAS domain-containing protein